MLKNVTEEKKKKKNSLARCFMPLNATVIFGSLLQSHAAEFLLYYTDNLGELMSFIIAGMASMHLVMCALNMHEYKNSQKLALDKNCQVLVQLIYILD